MEYSNPQQRESPPKFVAPHHPRLDHQLLYEGLGYDVVSCANLSHSISTRNPYRFTKTTAIERLMYRMVEGKFCHDAMVNTFFKENPFSDRGESSCPNAMRASLVALEPCRQRGTMHTKGKAMTRYWCRQRVHATVGHPIGRLSISWWALWIPLYCYISYRFMYYAR